MISKIKTQSLRKKTMLILIILIFCLSVLTVAAQDDVSTRSILPAEFINRRPAGKKNKPLTRDKRQTKNNPKSKSSAYKFVRHDKNSVRRKTNQIKPETMNNTAGANKPKRIIEIGLTMWKLRPPRSSDAGYKLPVLVGDQREMWTAERVSPDTPFESGDRVRLAVESSATGYLYVINSETRSDGSYGEPILIFPASTDEDNFVKPGLLVDLPDRNEDFPYFNIEPKQANYTGELLTVIVSPKPLTNMKIDGEGKIENLDELIKLEANSDAEIFSRNTEEDKIYTKTEACGSKTRQLTREKSKQNPCGTQTRQLTREEPLPQTIYRVKTIPGQPAVAFIKLNARS